MRVAMVFDLPGAEALMQSARHAITRHAFLRFSLRTGLLLAMVLAVTPANLGAQVKPLGTRWRSFDVNHDQRFGRDDIHAITIAGLDRPSIDANLDGKQDIGDSWFIAVQLTRWDRNANGFVDISDAAQFPAVVLPAPDAAAAAAVVAAVLKDVLPKIPHDLDQKLRARWKQRAANPDTLAALYQGVGAAALVVRNKEVAIWSYAKAASLAPGRAANLSNLAFAITYDDRLNEALTLLVRARQLEPKSCPVIDNTGFVLSRSGQLQEARNYYQDAVRLCPRHAQYHLNLAAILLRLDLDAMATQSFQRAADLNPQDMEAMLMAISVKPASAAFDEAIDELYEQRMKEASAKLRAVPTVDPIAAQMQSQLAAAGVAINPGAGFDEDKWEEAVALSFMAISVAGVADGSLDKCNAGDADSKAAELPGDLTVGASVGILGLEYKPRTCEIKVQAGQGLLLATSWSPFNGVGAQVGVGFDVHEGPIKLGGAAWLKFGSDGSISREHGVTAGVKSQGGYEAGYGIDSTTTIQAAQNEPTGASAFLADFLACDKS